MASYPPKYCICGARLWTFGEKLRHQESCDKPIRERREVVERGPDDLR